MKRTLKFKPIALLLLRFSWVILLCAIIGFSVIFFTTEYNKVPLYTANASIFVRNRSSEQIGSGITTADQYASKELVNTYIKIIKSNRVLDQVVKALDNKYTAAYIKNCLGLRSADDTEVMELYVTTTNPERSAEICNAVLEVVPDALIQIVKVGSAEIIDPATVPKYSSNPMSLRKSFYGAILGVFGSVALILLIYVLDTRIKNTDDIKQSYDIPILGEIPNFSNKTDERYSKYYDEKTT